MGGLKYGGLIDAWKVSMITKRAKRYAFTDDEILDLKQKIVSELIKVDFFPGKPRGAAETTFVIEVIDRQLNKVLRDRKRNVRRANYETDIFDEEEIIDQDSFFIVDESKRTELRIDLKTVMAGMSADEIKICAGLMQGDSQSEIARAMGRSKAAISNAVARLREKLREWGLKAL